MVLYDAYERVSAETRLREKNTEIKKKKMKWKRKTEDETIEEGWISHLFGIGILTFILILYKHKNPQTHTHTDSSFVSSLLHLIFVKFLSTKILSFFSLFLSHHCINPDFYDLLYSL